MYWMRRYWVQRRVRRYRVNYYSFSSSNNRIMLDSIKNTCMYVNTTKTFNRAHVTDIIKNHVNFTAILY